MNGIKSSRRQSEGWARRPSMKGHYNEPEEEDTPFINLRLGDANMVYENLEWILDNPGEGGRERASEALKEITEKNRALEAENQLLKFKVSVMQDMLAGTKLDMLKLQAQKT